MVIMAIISISVSSNVRLQGSHVHFLNQSRSLL